MNHAQSYTINSSIFQEFLMLLGRVVHSDLIRQMEYLKVGNEILRSKCPKRITTTPAEKRKLIKYGLACRGKIKGIISIVNYSTFRRWVNGDIRNKYKPAKQGRPKKTTQEIIDIIIRFARENLDWGYGRIMGELKKLNVIRLSRNTIKNIMRQNGLDPAPKRARDSWDAYIKRHFETLWACDFFTKTIWTAMGPKLFHVLFFLNIRTRKVHIAGITARPNKEWVLNASKSVSFLFKDKRIPYRSPNLNPYAEGFVGTIKRECLEHFFVFGERHFEYLVREYLKYYNTKRPHSGRDNKPLEYQSRKSNGKLKCDSRLGGMIRHYYWG